MELSKFTRGYLNADEKNFYMVAKLFIQMINGEKNVNNQITNELWVEWKKRGMLTEGMQKHIKLVKSYLIKFCNDIEENIDDAERRKLEKQLIKFEFRLVDDFTVKKLYRDHKNNKYIVIEREKFNPIIEELAEIKCIGCKEDYKTCCLYKAFDDISLGRVEEESNCPYAVDLSKCKPNEVKRIEEVKKN